MMDMRFIYKVLVAFIVLATGCTKPPERDDSHVRALVQARIAKPVRWYQDSDQEPQIVCLIQHLLQHELTVDTAIQIALFNNPSIQATFEELGIKQADLARAGLFQNPIFQGFVRFPDHHNLSTNSEFSITQSFLEIFLIPLKKKFAETALKQAELTVAHTVLDIAFTVRELYYSLQAELIKEKYLSHIVDTTKASFLLAEKQYIAGNINELELQHRNSAYIQATLDCIATQNQIADYRKKLNTLLGLRAIDGRWSISTNQSVPLQNKLSYDVLEAKAGQDRLDIQIARLELNRIAEIGATKKWWAYTNAGVGVSGEKEPEGGFVLGPLISLDIPLFNHGQADRARLLAELKQSKHELKALEIEMAAELKQVLTELATNLAACTLFEEKLIPMKKEIVATSERYYNVMGIGVYTLLLAKKEELETEIAYTMQLRDYWLSRVRLDRVVGGEVK